MVMDRNTRATPADRAEAAANLAPELADFISLCEQVNHNIMRDLLAAEQLLNFWNAKGLGSKLTVKEASDAVKLAFDGIDVPTLIEFVNALKTLVRAFGDGQAEPKRDAVAGVEANLVRMARQPVLPR